MLQAKRWIDAAPGMERVIGFDDIFAAIVQAAVAQQKSFAAQREIFLVFARDSVGNEDDASAVPLALPKRAFQGGTKLIRLIHFRVGVGFVLPFVPSPASEDA